MTMLVTYGSKRGGTERLAGMVADALRRQDFAVEVLPAGDVRKLMDRVDARDHATFGGRLAPDAKGVPASAMAKTNAGDWRDADYVDRWVASIAADLRVSAT